MGGCGGGGERRERYLALYSAQFFLAIEHAVEFTHVGRARPRRCKRPIDISLPPTCTRTRFREVLCVLTLILRHAFFPLRTSLLR